VHGPHGSCTNLEALEVIGGRLGSRRRTAHPAGVRGRAGRRAGRRAPPIAPRRITARGSPAGGALPLFLGGSRALRNDDKTLRPRA